MALAFAAAFLLLPRAGKSLLASRKSQSVDASASLEQQVESAVLVRSGFDRRWPAEL